MLPNVIVTMNASPGVAELISGKMEGKATIRFLHGIKGPEREAALKSADVILSMFFPREIAPGEEVLMEKVSLLQMITAGVDSLPFDRIPAHVAVASNRGGWSRQISEHALALALACSRRIAYFHDQLREGKFIQKSPDCPLSSLHGKTLGVLGYGGIGRASAHLFRALGMKVMAVNRTGRSDGTADWFGNLDRLDEVLEASDVLLIALPLNRRTAGLIGPGELNCMKEEAIVINIARAAIMDEKALYEHLRDHPRFQAGLDVWWEEPTFGGKTFGLKYPFFDLPNLVGSPHNSNQKEDELLVATDRALENLLLFLREGRTDLCEDRTDYV
jgi:glycerate dehydrogenase